MRRLVLSIGLAALCVLVLGGHTYLSFTRARVRLVTEPRLAEQPSIVIPLPPQIDRLAGQKPLAIIVRASGGAEAVDLALWIDEREVARFTAPADREVRIDTSMPSSVPALAREVSLRASRPGWTLSYLELATVHGFSSGLFSFVIVPRLRSYAPIIPLWMLIPLFIVLVAARPEADWPRGRVWRMLHRTGAALILLLFLATLVVHRFTQFLFLLSFSTWFLGVAVLYGEPLARVWRSLQRAWPHVQRAWMSPMEARRLPWWVTALDVLCLVLVALMLRAWTGDIYRLLLPGGLVLSLSSWPRHIVGLMVLLAVRHYYWKEPFWHLRVIRWIRSAWMWDPLRAARPPFVISRITALGAGYVAVVTIGFSVERPWRALNGVFLDLFARWDAGWYHKIADAGYPTEFYPDRMSEIAFFPGLPLLMRIIGTVLDVNLWVAGILVVTTGFLCGLMYFYRLALEDLPDDQARASLMFLAFYPFAFCYSAILTEGVFLLAAVAGFYHFRRHELWRASLFGLLAGLLRPNGCLLSIPLALVALLPFARSRGWLPGQPEAPSGWKPLIVQLIVAGMPGVGMLAYAAYVSTLTGNPFAWVEAQQAWGRASGEIFRMIDARSALIEAQGFAAYPRNHPIEILEGAAAFLALGAIVPIMRRFGLPYALFVALSVIPPLFSMGSISLGRYTAPLFPIFLWLGATVPAERRPYWIALFAGFQALLSALFFTWRPPY